MPSWEDLMNCVCQNGPQRPGVQEVLDTLQRSTVCTGTQCFETEVDAFGLQAAPSGQQDNSSMFFMMMMYAQPASLGRGGCGASSPGRSQPAHTAHLADAPPPREAATSARHERAHRVGHRQP